MAQWSALRLRLALAISAATVLAAVAVVGTLSWAGLVGAAREGSDAARVYSRAAPAVVAVGASGQRRLVQELGSGFVVEGGLVLTAAHVVQRFDRYAVRTGSGSFAEVEVTERSLGVDLAVLRPSGTSARIVLAPLVLAGRRPTIGESVVAIGSPDGLEGSLTMGVVSGLRKAKDVGLAVHGVDPELVLIQTDATVGHGNSGGPLLALDGTVLGMVIAAHGRGERFGFAVQAQDLRVAQRGFPPSTSPR